MPIRKKVSVSWLRVGYLILAAIAMYVLISQLSSLKGSLHELRFSRIRDDSIVLLAVSVTYLFAALTYYLIALKPLHYIRTTIVEIAVNSVNRLLPAGIGGIGANYVYLRNSKHSGPEAATVVAVNSVLGIIANLLLIIIIVSFFRTSKLKLISGSAHLIIIGLLLAALAATIIVIIPSWRKHIGHEFNEVLRSLKQYKHRKKRLIYGLACQMALCLAFVLGLYFSLQAVHVHLPIGSVMLAYSFAIWLGAAIPAPGGVGSVEAGLSAALIAFKVDITQAVAAVLIFRLLSFWLPLFLGIVPLVLSFKRGYL